VNSPYKYLAFVYTKPPIQLVESVNLNGLRGKIEEIRLRIAASSPHVLACQETKLSAKVDSNTLSVTGYRLFRRDRTENGGGVALYVNDKLNAVEVKTQFDNNLEIVSAKFTLGSLIWIAASIYKPPRVQVDEFCENLTDFVSSLGNSTQNLILAGDLNLCFLLPEFKLMQNWCDVMEMTQVIKYPTHNKRLIDHIYVPKSVVVDSAGIEAPVERVHAQTWVKLCLPVPQMPSLKSPSWIFKKANWLLMNIRLMQLSTLQLVEAAPDVSSAMLLIEENIHKVMLECIPKSNGRAKKHTEWITENLLNLFRQKSKAYRKWKKCESNTWRATYKLYVKQIKKGIFMAKKDFFLKSLDGCHDPGSFWRGLNRFTGRKQREDIPTLNTQSGGEAITDKEKAEVLMLQFASVFQSSETEVNISLNSPSTVEFISKASVKRIHQIITQIPNKKAHEIDSQ
jgi:hypothetical protein